MAEPARVLHVVGGMARGGAETMIMNLYRQVDRARLQFDFLCTSPGEHSYDAEIRELGGRIIHIDDPAKVGYIAYLRQVRRAIDANGPFRAVHAHTLFNTGLVAAVAKRAGVPVRVCHAHNTADIKNSSLLGALYRLTMRRLIRKDATHLVACGKDAGCYLFGENAWNANRVILLPNGLDLSAYETLDHEQIKQKYDHEFGFMKSDIILGHVAGFRPQKNHIFLIKLMEKLLAVDPRYKLILVGDGETRPKIEALVAEHSLQDSIVFTGVRSDIPALMTYFDVFLLPSLYEGLPVTVVEAQAVGAVCVLSDSITREVDLGMGLINWASLEDIDTWLQAISQALVVSGTVPFADRSIAIREHGYDVRANIGILYDIYGV